MYQSIKSFISRHRVQAVAILVSLIVFIGYLNDFHGFYNNYIKQTRAEDSLKLMNTGVSIQHVKGVFGPPITERRTENKRLTEYIYSFKNFYLQVVFDIEKEVVFYAVTSKNINFKPLVPYFKKELGITFNDFSDSYSGNEANWSSKFFEYNENIYLGNFGNYRNIYLAYNPAGIDYGNIQMLPLNEMPSPSKEVSDEFRKRSYPNTYGVGASYGGRGDKETTFGIGIEYFSSRDLPEHNF